MVDNVTTPINSGTVFATDEVSGVHYQIVKITFGTPDTATPISNANPLPVSIGNFPATQPVSATNLPLPTGAATSAKQPAIGTAGTPSADVITVQGIGNGILLPTLPAMNSGGNTSVTTNAVGTNFTTFASQACKQLTLVNNTGTIIEFQQGGTGVAVPIFDKAAYTIFGITNNNQIGVRRTDTSNTTVTVQARWEA